MASFQEDMLEYRLQLQKGAIQRAYRGLMEYLQELSIHFNDILPGGSVSSSLYFGYMDMTYFAIFPPSLTRRDLKIAVVFLHPSFRFETWLAGKNKRVQKEYWEMFRSSGEDKYRLAPAVQGYDSILECTSAAEPDFSDKRALTERIETATLEFIQYIEDFLAQS